jgi:protein-S-isoprenylcysteine O-methyltransferase Ste14
MPHLDSVHTAPHRDPEDSTQEPYPRPGTIQSAGLVERLRRRKVTWRTLLVYGAALILLLLADPRPGPFMAGTLIIVAGLLLRIWTFGHLRKNLMLVTTGPYAYTRNPAYLGSALILIGLFLAAGNSNTIRGLVLWAIGLVGIGIFFATYLPRKYAREYGKLAALFPDQIERHAAYVPDFFPRFTPWRSGDPRRFSWRCVSANHEWVWPIACALALILMWCA